MKKNAFLLLATLLFSVTTMANKTEYSTQNPPYKLDGKAVFGRLESAYFTGNDSYKHIPFDAKIDTGADTTSMHADNIHVYSANPKYKGLRDRQLLKTIVDEYGGPKSNWWLEEFDTPQRDLQLTARFTITHPYSGEALEFEAPLARVSVVRSRTSTEPLYRPVVKLKMKIGTVEIDTEASLTDRSNFSTPILIGKTFLKKNAWVLAGYDYLQDQAGATLIGREETMQVNGVAMDVSVSMQSRSSVLHATNIQVDKKAQKVSFDTKDNQGNKRRFTLPLAGMVRSAGTEKPEVYISVKGDRHFNSKIRVYLKDRSKASTQLRLGLEVLSKHFVINAAEKQRLSEPKVVFSESITQNNPLVVSPQERITIDGVEVYARPDVRIKTPLLKVSGFEISGADKGEQVSYYLVDEEGRQRKFVKPVVRKIRVGNSVRPVVTAKLEADGKYTEYDIALEVPDNPETLYKKKKPIFFIGQKTAKGGVIINTRSEYLLQSHDIVKAGYIETASVEGLSFAVKLDTGADVSSMHAEDIRLYKKDGKQMVDFVYRNAQGDKKSFTRQVVRMMTVKAKHGEKANHRPVVKMEVQLGDIRKTIKVNLQDRSRFEYSMILGKNFLRYGVVVSSDEPFLLGK